MVKPKEESCWAKEKLQLEITWTVNGFGINFYLSPLRENDKQSSHYQKTPLRHMILHGFLSWIGFVDFMSYMFTLFSDGNFTAKQGEGGGISHLLYRGRVSLLRNSHLNGKQKTGLGIKHPSYCLQQSSVKTDASHWTLKMYFWTTHSTKKTKIKWQLFCIEMKFWSVNRVTAESVFPNGQCFYY